MFASRCKINRVRLCALAVCLGTLVAPTMAYDLQRHVWQDRLLFLVAPDFDEPGLQHQLNSVAEQRAEVLDRDLRVFALGKDSGEIDGEPLTQADVLSLRDQLRLAPHARAVILIGLDGGIKSRTPIDTSLSDIFRRIDAMPMRQQELRERSPASPQ